VSKNSRMPNDKVRVGLNIAPYVYEHYSAEEFLTKYYDLRKLGFVCIPAHTPTGLVQEETLYKWAEFFAKNNICFVLYDTVGRITQDESLSADSVVPGYWQKILTPEIVKNIKRIAGDYFAGVTVSEMGGTASWPKGYFKRGVMELLKSANDMQEAKDNYVKRVSMPVEVNHDIGVDCFVSVEASAFSKYNYEAGIDISCFEMMCGDPEVMIAATRGAAIAYGREWWGAHIAHSWYGGCRHDDPLKQKRLMAEYNYAYLAGANPIWQECGDFHIKSFGYYYTEEHEFCRAYRETWDKFAGWVANDKRPEGNPLVKVAFVHGNLDAYTGWYTGSTVWNKFDDEEWGYSAPEQSWKVLDSVTRGSKWHDIHVFGDNDVSNAPAYGQYDIVPADMPAELMSAYDYLIFTGWNTMTSEIYENLKAYVKNGGNLLLSAAHLNTSAKRTGELKLIHDGELADFLGCKLKPNGPRLNMGVKFVKESLMPSVLYPAIGNLDHDAIFSGGFVQYANVEMHGGREAAFAAETFKHIPGETYSYPVLVENKYGDGCVSLLTCLDYPGAAGIFPLYCQIVKQMVSASHRNCPVKVLANDKVAFSVYRNDDGVLAIYILNTDYNVQSNVIIQYQGESMSVALDASELKRIDLTNYKTNEENAKMVNIKHMCITPDCDNSLIGVKLISENVPRKVICTAYDRDKNKIAYAEFEGASQFSLPLDNFTYWTPDNPYLYTLDIETDAEKISARFGMRKLESKDGGIYLNNKPFYMRGFIRGTICHDHNNNCNISLYDWYVKNIRAAKAYGFNYIRFHTMIPHRECFVAADELGIFIHIEMRKDKTEYNNLEEMIHTKGEFIDPETVRDIVYTHFNHPSLMTYCVGNEIHHPGRFPAVRRIVELARELDPTRLSIDTCAHGEPDRDYVDFDVHHMGYVFPFGKNSGMFNLIDKLSVYGSAEGLEFKTRQTMNGAAGKIMRGMKKYHPVIAHEVCHYAAIRDFYSLREKFKKYNAGEPWWIEEEIKMFEAKGNKERFYDLLKASKAFQFMCWKIAFEAIRHSELLNGFHMLQFSDTDRYENSNGIVDCFDDPSGVNKDEFLKFNGDTVILADLPVRSFFEGDTFDIPVSVSSYTQSRYGKCEFEYRLIDTGKGATVISGSMDDFNIDGGGLINLCKLKITLPPLERAVKYELALTLSNPDGTICSNNWSIWSYANKPQDVSFEGASINMKSYNIYSRYTQAISCPRFGEKLYITDICDEKIFEQLKNGGDVLLLYREQATRHLVDRSAVVGEYSLPATWERFKGVIWDRGTNYGGIINNAQLFESFPNDGISDLQFYNLIEDSDKIILDDFPVGIEPAFEGIDKCTRDRFDVKSYFFGLPELMYDRTLRKSGYIFELGVGKGRLLVSGLNFMGLGQNTPEVCAMFEAILGYMHSGNFNPKAALSVEELKNYMQNRHIMCERIMTHEWQRDLDQFDFEEADNPAQYFDMAKQYINSCDLQKPNIGE